MGITSLLNIAKTALLTQQLAIQTKGHNVANVNTEGYSRQTIDLTTQFPNRSTIGPLGNGVTVDGIRRAYDAFINKTLNAKISESSNLETKQSAMKTIESILNEVDKTGLSAQLDRFWAAWDNAANNAEGVPERSVLIQEAELLVKEINDRYSNMFKLSQDIKLNIKNAVDDINQLSTQIADLNVQIVAMEASGGPANDLRDQRDLLLKKLSGLVGLEYFETTRGTYSIVLENGLQLVETDRSWELSYDNGKVNWVSSNGTKSELTSSELSKGELGGWIDIASRVEPSPSDVLIGSEYNTTGGRQININTKWTDIDGVNIWGSFTITFSGIDQDGYPVKGAFTYDPAANPDGTVDDFLNAIEDAFKGVGKSISATINSEGRLQITDNTPGDYPIAFQIESISGDVSGLSFGKFDGRYPSNYINTLNKWATNLIAEVNAQHAQGVGLNPMTETIGVYNVINSDEAVGYRSSGLYFADRVQDGQFEIWLYDSDGNVIDYDPSTPEVNDPFVIEVKADTTSVDDIKDAINNIQGLTAKIVDGHLTVGIDTTSSIAGFAFGRDTSNALLALGLNAFFEGVDAESIDFNSRLKDDPSLIALGQIEERGASIITGEKALSDAERPLGIDIRSGTFSVTLYDQNGIIKDTEKISIDPQYDTIHSVIEKLNAVDGIYAEIDNGKLKITKTSDDIDYITFDNDVTGVLEYLGIRPFNGKITALNAVDDATASLGSMESGLSSYGAIDNGGFYVRAFNADRELLDEKFIEIDPDNTSLEGLRDALNESGLVTASIENNRLVIDRGQGFANVIFQDDSSNVLKALKLPESISQPYSIYQVEDITTALQDHALGVRSGSFKIYMYDENGTLMSDSPVSIEIDADYDNLNAVAEKLNAIDGISAKVESGRLTVSAEADVSRLLFAEDTTGLLDILGIRTPKGGTFSPASNENALSIREIARYSIDDLDGATLNEGYQNLVSEVGIQSRTFSIDYEFYKSAVNELEIRRDEITGVSLDEELSDLLKYQHAYTAAAKLIKTADEVFLSLLQAKL